MHTHTNHTHARTFRSSLARAHTHTPTHTHTHTHPYTYTHTYTHTHKRMHTHSITHANHTHTHARTVRSSLAVATSSLRTAMEADTCGLHTHVQAFVPSGFFWVCFASLCECACAYVCVEVCVRAYLSVFLCACMCPCFSLHAFLAAAFTALNSATTNKSNHTRAKIQKAKTVTSLTMLPACIPGSSCYCTQLHHHKQKQPHTRKTSKRLRL